MGKKRISRRERSPEAENDDAASNAFEYREIEDPGEIRLIKVHQRGKHIGVRLEHYDLDNAPDYSALSYTWGDATRIREIMVNRRQFPVRLNLYQFLEVFQARHQNEWLWVDQICINQADTQERNSQVQLMSEIYRNAFEVKIWLGPDDHPDPRIFRERIRGTSASRSMKQEALGEMFSNPYWGRLWILQEILLARRLKIYHGFDFIDWSSFQLLCDPDHKDALVNAPEHVRWMARRATSARQILVCDAILHCTDNDCTDPRGKIYGIQSLLLHKHRLKVDYAKRVEHVFLQAAIMIAKSKVCTIDEGHEMVCPDAPAECECPPWGEMEFIVRSIGQLAYAMGLTNSPMAHRWPELEDIMQQFRHDPNADNKVQCLAKLRDHFSLPEYKID